MTADNALLHNPLPLIGLPETADEVDHDADTERYFTLIVGCAKATIEGAEDYSRPHDFWSKRIHHEWVQVTDVLRQLGDGRRKYSDEQRDAMTMTQLGRLARESLMAAWALANYALAGDDDPENLEFSVTYKTPGLLSEM